MKPCLVKLGHTFVLAGWILSSGFFLELTLHSTSAPSPASAAPATSRYQAIEAHYDASPSRSSLTQGILLALLPNGRATGECPLKHTDVIATVSGYVARVKVKQTFQNSYPHKIEALYTFPLPETAAVDEMTINVGQRLIRGVIKKREEAQEIYQRAKMQGRLAALLDQERSNIFTQAVANIEPGQTVTVELQYVELIPYESGTFSLSFPTVVGPRFNPDAVAAETGLRRWVTGGPAADNEPVPDAEKLTPRSVLAGQRSGHDISISVNINSAVPSSEIKSKLHKIDVKQSTPEHAVVTLAKGESIPNKDFVLSWKIANDKLSSGYLTHRDAKSGYFTLMILPPARVTPEHITPKEMVFLIDCSGSQAGAPLQKAKETLTYIVDHMNTNDTFQIIAFNDRSIKLAEYPLIASPDMRLKAKNFIEKLQANGGTWMASAVSQACALPHKGNRLRIVTFMTDGYVGDDLNILGLVKQFRGDSRWFSFGTGNSVNRFLIDGVAREGGGEAEYVLLNSSAEEVGRKFYDRISSPVLTDVKLGFDGLQVEDVYPAEVADVWAQRPLYIKGRYLRPGAGTVTLTGFAAGKPYKQELAVVFPEKQASNGAIKSTWARAKIDKLMSEDWFGAQHGSVKSELKDEIIQTALEHHIMTQYTSFVAVDESRVTSGGAPKKTIVPTDAVDGLSMTGQRANREAFAGGGSNSAGAPCSMCGSSVPTSASGSNSSESVSDPDVDYGPYMAYLERRIKKQWDAPMVVGKAVVSFTLALDGKITDIKTAHSSGSIVFDKSALAALNAAAPFRELPRSSPASVQIQFTFDSTETTAALVRKLDAVLRAYCSSGNQAPANALEVNADGDIKVFVQVPDTTEETLKQLGYRGLKEIELQQGEESLIPSVTGRISQSDLKRVCELTTVVKVSALSKHRTAEPRIELQDKSK